MKHPEQALDLAYALAAYAHAGQVDKAGKPYILHPLAVSQKVWTNDMKIVALLHDVLEDTAVTRETILNLFGQQILEAVEALTRMPGESYSDFIERAGQNQIARIVKLADLNHNMDLSRLSEVTKEDRKRYKKYEKAVAKLNSINLH